ncbi:MAG: MBL fold metallo-hydrolase [Nitrospira sp.]|nr:MBL fold metallo-hydrolase [Nitrospira sp.]
MKNIERRRAVNRDGATCVPAVARRILMMLALVGLLGQSWPVFGQESRPENEITSLGDGVYAFRHQFHQAIFITTPKGVIVTDPISAEAATWLKKEIGKYSDQPVRYVIYSHHHDDHITGGSLFADQALFVSQAGATAKIREAADPRTPLPDLTFTDRLFIDLGGKHVELIYTGKNHSDNSLVVLLPEQKLLFAVDFIPVETVAYRTMKSDYPDDWIESLKRVEQLDFDRLVPGHGKIGNKAHVRMFRGYLEDLRAAVQEQLQKGASLEEAKKAVQLPKYERWQHYGDWFPENVEGMYRYLSQRRETK